MKALGKNAGILRYALNDTPLWPPSSRASEMMEGENVYCLIITFMIQRYLPTVEWPSYHRLLDWSVAQWKDLWTQAFFNLKRFLGLARNDGVGLMNSIGKCRISKKVKALRRPAEASQRSGKNLSIAITVLKHLVIARRHDEAISFMRFFDRDCFSRWKICWSNDGFFEGMH